MLFSPCQAANLNAALLPVDLRGRFARGAVLPPTSRMRTKGDEIGGRGTKAENGFSEGEETAAIHGREERWHERTPPPSMHPIWCNQSLTRILVTHPQEEDGAIYRPQLAVLVWCRKDRRAADGVQLPRSRDSLELVHPAWLKVDPRAGHEVTSHA